MKNFVLFICIALLFITACSNSKEPPAEAREELKNKEKLRLSIWLPEWQNKSAIEDVKNSQHGLQDIRVFGAYFNSKDELLLTENAIDMLQQTQQQFNDSHHVILTLINDYVTDNAPSVQKDSTLLHRLLQDSAARQKHISNILQVVDQYQVDGIEIDYEKVAQEDLQKYVLFLDELYQALSKKEVTLHVVLEPRFPFNVKLPDGPTYTVMAYNVHGYHSGPGAKATFSFLNDLVKKIKKSNQDLAIAFATGGFKWVAQGKTVALTELEAEQLLAETNAVKQRDKGSGAVYFTYVDDSNVSHEVWYADQETLEKWVKYVQKKSYHDVVLWRAGGLGERTLQWIGEQTTN
ncbi:glycosyl hydrolase family 18 protein [Lysinibacillus cavernae]|uniref:glycosyl hydrolase family 18 protein n=1 Tax=Lysinibacillus cavernae TaxID=2666135 RepID=UPI001E5B6F9D|nr:glycosyl hydrolase family 18 protein [Lysinibacillus cavernae]